MVRTKPKSDKVLTIRLPEKDLIHLERYCFAKGRTKTEVLRQLIQSLPPVLEAMDGESTENSQGSSRDYPAEASPSKSNFF